MSLPPLTYTFLADYKNCPKKAHHRFVLKDLPKEPESEAMRTGIAVHEAIEKRINAGEIPMGLKPPPGGKIKAEWKLGAAKSGRWVGFFQPDVWLRGKLDLTLLNEERTIAMLVDWKTGRVREDPFELQVQAVLLKGNVPDLKVIRGCYSWLKEKRMGTIYDLSDTAKTLEEIRAIEIKMHDGQWDPEPNPLCGWCPVKACKYNRS